jgi:hypothetical protein
MAVKLNYETLREELRRYRSFRKPSKYKDGKAEVLIALKPPKYTKMGCAACVPTEHTYSDYEGKIRTYTRREKDECPYRGQLERVNYGYEYCCMLFGSRIGYRGYRLEICKYVFGKRSKNMIKTWRSIKGLDDFIREGVRAGQVRTIDRLRVDAHIGDSQHKKALKAIQTWFSEKGHIDDIDKLLTKAVRIPRSKLNIRWHRHSPCTSGGSYIYGSYNRYR